MTEPTDQRTAATPPGWHLAGSVRAAYVAGVDFDVSRGEGPSGYLRSKRRKINGFGTLMQSISPVRYAGKRIRLSCHLKTADVRNWAGLWARVDRPGSERPLAFDNMEDRPVKGTTDWTECTVVLDVGHRASNIAFGVLLDGTGTVWIDGMTLDIVDASVPTTGNNWATPAAPRNLGFNQDPDEASTPTLPPPIAAKSGFAAGRPRQCSFCHKSAAEVDRLIVGGGESVHICDECVALCVDILKDYQSSQGDDAG